MTPKPHFRSYFYTPNSLFHIGVLSERMRSAVAFMGVPDPVAAQEKDSRKYQYYGCAKAYRKLRAIVFREKADLEMTQRSETHDHEGIDGHHASPDPVIRQALDRGVYHGKL